VSFPKDMNILYDIIHMCEFVTIGSNYVEVDSLILSKLDSCHIIDYEKDDIVFSIKSIRREFYINNILENRAIPKFIVIRVVELGKIGNPVDLIKLAKHIRENGDFKLIIILGYYNTHDKTGISFYGGNGIIHASDLVITIDEIGGISVIKNRYDEYGLEIGRLDMNVSDLNNYTYICNI
jgi:hypothetical protein